jgi:CRISPR-associated protein Cmr6
MVRAAGPLGRVIESHGKAVTSGTGYRLPGYEFRAGTNPLIMLNRVAFVAPPGPGDGHRVRLDDDGQRALLRWAADQALGQACDLVADVARRRDAAVAALRRQGLCVRRLRAQPEWRLAVGLGNKANAHEIGLSLHGTYGWPVIPGTSLKGLAAAWAVASDADPADVRRVFGTPRLDVPPPPAPSPDGEGGGGAREPKTSRGTVSFLDAIPAGAPVKVEADVMTPHVKPYYDAIAKQSSEPPPPAEYHNPVPVHFLTVRGTFAVDLYGRDDNDLNLASEWLRRAGEDFGAGGKTAAGYGYLAMTNAPGDQP